MGKPEGKRPLGKNWRRCEDNVKRDLAEIGWGGVVGLGTGLSWRSIRSGVGLLCT
jgi:hypothetical protein